MPLKLKDSQLLKTQAFVAGAWLSAGTTEGASFPVVNPADGSVFATVPNLGAAETERAIAAAQEVWPAWRERTGKERANLLRKWFDLINSNADDLAQIITAEQGKPLAEARAEVTYGASFVEWFAEEAKRVCGDTLATSGNDRRLLTLKQPIGVSAAITPWNFPLAMITRKVAPALAAGCPVVVKPAEQTPLSALALAELACRAGLPAGVFNVVTGDAKRSVEIGKALCASPIVRKLSFTGSTEVGRLLMQQCAPTVKKLSLELGGNAPFIVFADADLDLAVAGAVNAKYRNTGQTCICANRIYVQSDIYDAFVDKFADAVAKLAIGRGDAPGVVQGPLIDERAVAKVESHIADALALGGRLVAGGKRSRLGGTFFEPTIIADVSADMKVAREETFGPLAPIFRFNSEAEVVAAANATEYGLAAYFFTRDIGRAWRVGEALEYGMVGVNTGAISNEIAPFGGVKQSGLGREGSKYGIEEYLEIKYLCMGGI